MNMVVGFFIAGRYCVRLVGVQDAIKINIHMMAMTLFVDIDDWKTQPTDHWQISLYSQYCSVALMHSPGHGYVTTQLQLPLRPVPLSTPLEKKPPFSAPARSRDHR